MPVGGVGPDCHDHGMSAMPNDSPCDAIPVEHWRLREICLGTAVGLSERKRRVFIERFRADGTLTADPDDGKPATRSRRPQQETRGPAFSIDRPCVHLGEELRIELCQLCGRKGDPAPVHTCALHGECTVLTYGLTGTDRKKLPRCIGCREYESRET